WLSSRGQNVARAALGSRRPRGGSASARPASWNHFSRADCRPVAHDRRHHSRCHPQIWTQLESGGISGRLGTFGPHMKPRLVGINHVALQVADLEEAVAFFTALVEPTAVDLSEPGAAFLEIGDQFNALY